MLNTTKLIYILPEVAYVAELLAGKKPHTFTVHSFRQINGEFIKKNTLISKNILKLFSKIEEGEYTLVLPDTFFTDTIITVDGTSDAKIQDYISEKTLPKLKLSNDTHHIESYVLTEFKGSSQVQVSALEKKRVATVRAAVSQTSITLSAVISLSWSIKSLISLEPSASVIQVGSDLYTAKQYIGVDTPSSAPVSDAKNTAESIKTLKGSDPNLQTVYLISNELVEETLKDELNSVIPVQQLASQKEDDSQMPSYVRLLLEATGRTLSIKEFPVPRFGLDKASDTDLSEHTISELAASDETANVAIPVVPSIATISDSQDEGPAEETLPEPTTSPDDESSDEDSDLEELPQIATVGAADETTELDLTDSETDAKSSEVAEVAKSAVTIEDSKENTPLPAVAALGPAVASDDDLPETDTSSKEPIRSSSPESERLATETKLSENTTSLDAKDEDAEEEALDKLQPVSTTAVPVSDEAVDLRKFSKQTAQPAAAVLAAAPLVAPKKETIKNKGGVQNMLKMILITTAVFIVTVALGVGVGLGILSLTNRSTTESPVVVTTPTPAPAATPEPTPEPTPVVELNTSEYDILVVNATTRAGYAGTISDLLEDYGTIRSGNARGTYDDGMYVSFAEDVPGLLEALERDTELTLTVDEDAISTEDPAGTYDAVIILAE